MKDCNRFKESVQSLIAGSPRLEQLEEFVEHCRTCSDCRDLFEMHRTLTDLGSRFDELAMGSLDETRALVIQEIAEKDRHRSRSGRMRAASSPLILPPLTTAALFAIVFVLGFIVSRFDDRSLFKAKDISDKAFLSESLKNADSSPYVFSNVAVKYLDNQRIFVEFDISRRVQIVEPTHSELVKEILMHSVLNPASTGAIGHFQNTTSAGRFLY
jgi:hypothetical protein